MRIKNEDTYKIMGSGLGLSTVRKLAQLYNGEATVKSEKGAGSIFTVTLRDAMAEEAAVGEGAGAAAGARVDAKPGTAEAPAPTAAATLTTEAAETEPTALGTTHTAALVADRDPLATAGTVITRAPEAEPPA